MGTCWVANLALFSCALAPRFPGDSWQLGRRAPVLAKPPSPSLSSQPCDLTLLCRSRPTPICVIFSCITNVVGLILAAVAAAKAHGCHNWLQLWLMVYAVLATFNIVFAFYYYHCFVQQVFAGTQFGWR